MMAPEIVAGIFGLAFVAMITPGPNNLVALTLSVGGELNKTARACGGIIAGTICLVVVCWFGAASVFEAFPVLQIIIVGLGCAYLMWGGATLFLSTWHAGEPSGQSFPSSFWGLAGFQFTNPKAWVLCVAAVSVMQGSRADLLGLAVLGAIFGVSSAISLAVWVAAGRLLPRKRYEEGTPPWISAILGLALIGTCVSLAISAI
ncbi:LysE family translocator [Aliiroseovarius sp. 2305UL8-7]|uniref:LysE family translocator n=1 Tax=Aliiroseovarius conchicola TaxID=3121637 RepID=UPI0035278FFC